MRHDLLPKIIGNLTTSKLDLVFADVFHLPPSTTLETQSDLFNISLTEVNLVDATYNQQFSGFSY